MMITNSDITYGSGASTYGRIYAGVDQSGDRKNITHNGTAYADLYAEGRINGSVDLRLPARGFDGDSGTSGYTSIRTVIKNPINFNNFTISLVDIKRAAQNSGGIYLNNPSVDGWRLIFRADGTVDIAGCKKVGSDHLARTQPTNCNVTGTVSNQAVPAIGAIFSEQSVIVSRPGTGAGTESVVQGRVTVASNAEIIIGGHINPEQPGTDVLGLIARNDMIVAKWAPHNLNWRAAIISQTGRRRSWDSSGSHGTMNFTGSQATNLSPYMDMFDVRNYNYDPNLLFLQPPYFPVLEEAYTILFFREVPV
jgi:hypothetical protein